MFRKSTRLFLILTAIFLSACSQLSSTPSVSDRHQVQPGETFYSIARRYGVSTQTLSLYNPTVVPHRLKAGTELRIPLNDDFKREGIARYTVQAGDTLSKLSDHFAVSLAQLKQSNPTIDHDRILPGQELIIPIRNRGAAGYIWPIAQPNLISGFGEEDWGLQKGVNLAASQGQTVFASKTGVVSFAGEMRSLGKVVIIQHEGDQQTVYASCEALIINEGDQVKTGQPIATVGFNSLVNDTALHFQFRDRGTPLPPENYLPLIVSSD